MQDAGAKEGETSAAIHGALDHFDAVDLSLGGACGPGEIQCRLGGTEITTQVGGEIRRQLADLAAALTSGADLPEAR